MNSMRCLSALSLTFALLALSTPAQGQVLFMEDFEGPLPGVQTFPAQGGYSFFGDGDDTTDVVVVEEVTDQEAFSGLQSFRIDLDGSAITTYYYYGLGGFLGFYGNDFGAAAGQAGADNPANYVFSFDIKIDGVTPGQDEVIEGNVSLFKSDYEMVNEVDLNNDGDMIDGYNIWSSNYSTNTGQEEGWTHVEWNLASGSTPTVPQTEGVDYFDTAVFDDETTIGFQLYPFNSPGGFGFDAGNVILIDNLKFEFIPPTIGAGDFDEDGDVDGQDFLAWQQGQSPNPFSAGDLAEWENNYNAAGALGSFAAVPEPTSLMLAALATLLAAGRRTRC